MSYGTDFPQADSHFQQAIANREAGELNNALFECEEALKIDSCFPDALNLKGMIFEDMGYDSRAIRSYEKAILFDPDFAEAIENLSRLKTIVRSKRRINRESPHQDSLVTIATFTSTTEAHLRKAKLEVNGIPAFLADEYMVTMNWLYSTAIGGVKLQVAELNVSQALRVLNQEIDPVEFCNETNASPEDIPRCPRCYSFSARYETFNPLFAFIPQLLTVFATSSAGGIPLPFLKRKWKCNDCGYSWKWSELLWSRDSEVTQYYIRKRLDKANAAGGKHTPELESILQPIKQYCISCSKVVEDDNTICPHCREPLDDSQSIDESVKPECPLCGKKVEENWRTCKYCGEELLEVTGYTCSKCGIDVKEEWKTCPNCGDSLEDELEEQPPHEYFCPYCNKPSEEQLEYCVHCGMKLLTTTGYTCSKCGVDVEEKWEYCPNCGDSLEEVEE